MKLSIVQFTPVFGDTQENCRRLRSYAEQIDADIIVFPELCTTGYFFQSKEEARLYAEARDGASLDCFRSIAEEHNAMVIGGFVESSDERTYNAAAIVMPGQPLYVYRKTHLFYKERYCFDEGDTGFFVVSHHRCDARVGTMICYDWRFPESARVLALKGADVIACPSNLITNVWHIAMPARALENKVYVAVPNRAGSEQRGSQGEQVRFTGCSVIYDYYGAVMAQASDEDDEILTVEIHPEATRDKSFNPLNDIFRDRRPAIYNM
ncbi:MAG: nitrilase-related carbon-nitrogen hydrolase [Bacteroidota bacterium]|nr:carbon-nitrogen hydrolase [Candidatus Kapabacteria bacterium]MDW8219736.1 nitrilase-related carbon-nitrogen hydrolase [Bacteroidota bacterium]